MNSINFYLLYGEDKGILNKEIDNLKNKLSINEDDVIYYDIENINDIIDEALTISMFSLNKFIIIDSTSYLSDKKEIVNIKLLEDYFVHYNPNSYLIFISHKESVDSRKRLVKLISSKGKTKKIEANTEYLSKYISDYVVSNGYKISNLDITYLLNRVGTNIDNITNELDKLMLYKINDKNITKDAINKLIEENIDNPIYDLVGFILKNDNSRALKIYNSFIQNGMDVVSLIPVIASQIRLLFQVKKLYNNGKSNDEIAKILDFKSVYRVKYLLSDSYYYSEEDLIKYLSKLADLDKKIKLGLVDAKTYLELFIAGKDM